jgi:predicted CXXCH cytochrome family protein
MRRKSLGLLAVAAAVLLPASYAVAYNPPAPAPGSGINGTVHDLGTAHNGMNYVAIPADPQQRICIFCHTPHNAYRLSPANGGTGVGAGPQAPDAFDYLPLWNHELTGNYASFSMYYNGPGAPQTGPHASQAIQNGMALGSTSLLCLSCHDGSVAINSYGNANQPATSQSGGGPTINGSYVIGLNNDLQNHHPIGFDYDLVQAVDTEVRSADTATLGSAGLVRDHLYSNAAIGSVASVECGTCHSVHNKGNTGETLLWRSDTSSRLCLTCHDKGTDPGAIVP